MEKNLLKKRIDAYNKTKHRNKICQEEKSNIVQWRTRKQNITPGERLEYVNKLNRKQCNNQSKKQYAISKSQQQKNMEATSLVGVNEISMNAETYNSRLQKPTEKKSRKRNNIQQYI